MAFTAKDVQALREKTGVGMMDCKKALVEADGDVDKAMDILREKGLASAAKKLVVSAGDKTGKIAVYGSTDGENWTILTTLETTKTYTEYEVALGDSAYTYIKLAGVDAQARVDYVIIEQ